MNEMIIEARDVVKIYKGKKHDVKAVNGVNLAIKKGEIFGLVGESGCGKTTLGQMLVNLNPLSEGEIIYGGENIAKLAKSERRALCKDIQIIFQDPYSSVNPKMTIKQLVEEPLIIHKIGTESERLDKVVHMLELVGLTKNHLNRYPEELSGGQRQRVAIAIALILRPSFVVCDEAVSALDVSVGAQVLNLLRHLQKELSLTYLFISHNLNAVSAVSDRIAVMYLGKIVEQGDALELSENALHPYTKALFSASLKIESERAERIVLKGDVPSPANPPSGCAFHTRCAQCADICKSEIPVLREVSAGRFVACHFVGDSK